MAHSSRKIFKDYTPNQIMLLPPSLDELIEAAHPVRVVSGIIDELNIDPLLAGYKGGGSSSYHPRLLLKVLVYGYLCNIYSSRKLEEAARQNIHFMWLGGMCKPDHNTINRFRTDRLKNTIKQIFNQVVLFLEQEGIVSLKTVFIDGTKIEANANRYSFVWGRSVKKSRERIEKQLEELWAYTQEVAKEELEDASPTEFKAVAPEKVKATIEKIDQALKGKPVDKKVKQKLGYVKKSWPENVAKYNEQEKILGERNSYSKTDNDATFMRMKEDHMKNGQLKPGYNLQISTNNQFILHYTLHYNPTDTKTLPEHLSSFKLAYGWLPKETVADAGYGSQENYELLERSGITPYIKYNSFDKEQKAGKKRKQDQFTYDKESDCYFCPANKPLHAVSERQRTKNGKEQTIIIYKNLSCEGCPLKERCNPKYSNKKLEINHTVAALREQAVLHLNSERGIKLRKQRGCDVETVFAQLKHNKGFKRFMLRGKEKVEIETGLLAIAHNLRKIAA